MRQVTGICIDMGVERLVVKMPDILGEFWKSIDPTFDTKGLKEEYLFSGAMHMSGWKHNIDGLLRRCLCSLKWFPHWLALLKGALSFLRTKTNIDSLASELRRQNKCLLATLIEGVTLPGFAAWRWDTLEHCLSQLLKVLDSLILFFPYKVFTALRDRTSFNRLMDAFGSVLWRGQLDFVYLLCTTLGQMLRWGGRCGCCEGKLDFGNDCYRKGLGELRLRVQDCSCLIH